MFKDVFENHSICKKLPPSCSTDYTSISYVESYFELFENILEKCHMEQDRLLCGIGFLWLTDIIPHAYTHEVLKLDEI